MKLKADFSVSRMRDKRTAVFNTAVIVETAGNKREGTLWVN